MLVFTCGPGAALRWRPPRRVGRLAVFTQEPLDPRWTAPRARVGELTAVDAGDAPRSDWYPLARAAVDRSLQCVGRSAPRLMGSVIPGVDLEDACAVRLLYAIAYRHLPPLFAFLQQVASRPDPIMLLDPLLEPELVRELFAQATGRELQQTIISQTTTRLRTILRLPLALRDLAAAAAPPDVAGFRDGTIAFVGSVRDLDFVVPSVDARPPGPVVVVLKTESAELRAACHAALASRGPLRVGTLSELAAHGLTKRGLTGAGGRIAAALGHAWSGPFRSSAARTVVQSLVPEFLTVARLALGVHGLFEAYRPAVVLGAFEKSAYGALVGSVRRDPALRIVNVQHGIIPRAHVLDRMRFDRFVVWNDATASTVAADGYEPMSSVTVAGNPSWETLQAELATGPGGPAEVSRWKGGAPLIAAFTQPPNYVFTPAAVCRSFLQILCEHVRDRPELRLLVKRHERDVGEMDPPLLATLVGHGRARIEGFHDLGLADALRLADVVTSVNSTVLADALAVGRRVVAIDTEGLLPRIPYVLGAGALVARSVSDAHEMLDTVMATRGSTRAASTGDPAVYPRFEESYAARLRRVFAAL